MKKPNETTDDEIASRRDEIIRRMIAMPPKPHAEMKIGKPKAKKRAKA